MNAGPVAAIPAPERTRAGAFVLVCLAYVGVTVGEQVLAPVLPGVSGDLGFDESRTGIAIGLLAGAIAVANLIGGAVLGRVGPKRLMFVAVTITTLGSVLAALAQSYWVLVAAQVLLGTGAGLYFPAGLRAVALVSGTGRRGFSMGLYGVAFSVGLALAALLGTFGSTAGWRSVFWASAGFGVVCMVGTATLRLDAPRVVAPFRFPLQAIIGLPTFIGAIGAVCQYGAMPYLALFAVDTWEISAGAAAALIAAGRIISIGAKVAAGASMDRFGAVNSARVTGLLLAATGLAWVLLPAMVVTYTAAAVFAGMISSLFPIANLVAVDRFGSDGPALGVYRSTQIAIGAIVGTMIGLLGATFGLRVTLAIAVTCPLLLLALRRPTEA